MNTYIVTLTDGSGHRVEANCCTTDERWVVFHIDRTIVARFNADAVVSIIKKVEAAA